jgi:hypothetical protein
MRSRIKAFRHVLALLALAAVFALAPAAAEACPNCKFTNNKARAQAYMYSILFMLSMPAAILSGFTFGFYRLWKKQQMHELLLKDSEPGDDLAD